jgi:hypothetical protein
MRIDDYVHSSDCETILRKYLEHFGIKIETDIPIIGCFSTGGDFSGNPHMEISFTYAEMGDVDLMPKFEKQRLDRAMEIMGALENEDDV